MVQELQTAGRRLPLTAAGAAGIHALVTGGVLALAYAGHLALLEATPPKEQLWVYLAHGLCLGLALLPAYLLAARAKVGSRAGRRLALLTILPCALAAALFASVQATFLMLVVNEGEVAEAFARLGIRLELLADELGWEVLLASRWVLPPVVLLLARTRGWTLKVQIPLTTTAALVGLLVYRLTTLQFFGGQSIDAIQWDHIDMKDLLKALTPPHDLALLAAWIVLPPALRLGDALERRWEGRAAPGRVISARLPSLWQRARSDVVGQRRSLVTGGALGLAVLAGLVAFVLTREPTPPERPAARPWTPSQRRRWLASEARRQARRRARDTPARRQRERLRQKLGEARKLHYEEKKLDQALACYDEAVDLAPNDPEAYSARSQLYQTLGSPNLALVDMDRAVELKPEDVWLLGRRSFIRLALGDTNGALEDQLKCSDLDPDAVHIYVWRAHLRIRLGQDELALQELSTALTLDKDSWWIHCERGNVHRRLGRTAAALRDYERALELQPRVWWVHRERASALRMIGDTEAAKLDQARGARDGPGLVFAPLWKR